MGHISQIYIYNAMIYNSAEEIKHNANMYTHRINKVTLQTRSSQRVHYAVGR